MRYQAIYKCRLCGRKFAISEKLTEKQAKKKYQKMRFTPWTQYTFSGTTQDLEIHLCENGDKGIVTIGRNMTTTVEANTIHRDEMGKM